MGGCADETDNDLPLLPVGRVIAGACQEMARQKKKLTPEQKAAKKKRQREYMTIFVNGTQKRVKRPPTIEGLPVDVRSSCFVLRFGCINQAATLPGSSKESQT